MQNTNVSKTWRVICAATLAVGVISLVLCSLLFVSIRRRPPTTIADIAYDRWARSRNTGFRVFIVENGMYVPYLVLTADYGGNVLLLREHLLDETRPFQPSPHGHGLWGAHDFGSYYPVSHIDNFLNTEFKDTLGEATIVAMVASDIVVTHKNSIGVTGRDSYVITRYVFLLSLRELGFRDLSTSVPEGERLRFFRGYHVGRVASFSDGREMPYWTRTSNNWTSYNVFTIGVRSIGSGTADVLSGVRPAFSLARSTPITTRTDIISGQTVFVLGTDNQ